MATCFLRGRDPVTTVVYGEGPDSRRAGTVPASLGILRVFVLRCVYLTEASNVRSKNTRLETSGHARAHEYAHDQVLVLSLPAHSQP